MSGGIATIGSIDLDLLGLAFELNDVEVTTPDPDVSLLRIDRIWGRFGLADLARMRLHWSDLVVQGLTLRLVEDH